MKINSLDHLVLTVRDIETTCSFYARVLGMEVVTFGAENRKALAFGSQKINLHETDRELEPSAEQPVAGSADLCLLTGDSMEQITIHLREQKIPVVLGPVQRTGATGSIISLYIRDPDGNLLEIAVPQE
jgi:catechol 2,3-dioxygenase-like lactoylglutathione lyase family enzyme